MSEEQKFYQKFTQKKASKKEKSIKCTAEVKRKYWHTKEQ